MGMIIESWGSHLGACYIFIPSGDMHSFEY